jgi:hypothetical protein
MAPRSRVAAAVLTSVILIAVGGAALVALLAWDRARTLAARSIVDPAFGYVWDVAPDAQAFERVVADLDRSPADHVVRADAKACPAILDVDRRDPFIREARLVIQAFSGSFSHAGPTESGTITLYDGPVMDAIDLRVPGGADVGGTPRAYAIVPQHLRSTYWITKNSFDLTCDGRPLRIRLHGPAVVSSAQPDAIQVLRQ